MGNQTIWTASKTLMRKLYQHQRRTGILDEIPNMVLAKKKEKEEEIQSILLAQQRHPQHQEEEEEISTTDRGSRGRVPEDAADCAANR